jgi:hypothetical protein
MPSPPTVKAVRCRLIYKYTDGFFAGSRFYIAYSGSAPSPTDCLTFGGDIASAWNSHIAGALSIAVSLVEVDVLDLASSSGSSGVTSTSHAGTDAGAVLSANAAINVEFGIARRYRGGKPRMFFPGPTQENLTNPSQFSTTFVSGMNSDVGAFFTAVTGASVGSMGTLTHVNVSFYDGVDTEQRPAGTWRGPGYKYPPKYRDTALTDTVESYITKAVVGSQRRRRSSTTP